MVDGKELFKGFLLKAVLPVTLIGMIYSIVNPSRTEVYASNMPPPYQTSMQSENSANLDSVALLEQKRYYSEEEYRMTIAKYFPPETVETWVDIFYRCESQGGDSQAIGDGGTSWGAAQINDWWFDNGYFSKEMWNDRLTLEGSIRIAFEISKGINGGSAVSGYTYYTHPTKGTNGVGGYYTHPWSCAKNKGIPAWLP